MPVISLVPHQPYPIAGIASSYDGFTVQNQGTTTIYFSQQQTINPDITPPIYDYTVPPGGLINWPSNEPCFVAIKATDLTGMISYAPLVADQAGTVSGGTVSIAGTVPISGNVGVPAGVGINGTVPVTGNVGVPGGVGINGAVTNAPQSNPVLLDTATVAVGTGAGTVSLYNAPLITALYTSLVIVITQGYSATQPLNANNYIDCNIAFIDTNSTIVNSWDPQWLADLGMQNRFTVPIFSGRASLNVQLHKPVTTSGGSFVVSIYGLSTPVAGPIYESLSGSLVGGQSIGWVAAVNQNTAATTTNLLTSKNGPATISFDNYNNSTQAGIMLLSYALNGVMVHWDGMSISAGSTNAMVPRQYNFPMLPIQMIIQNTVGGNDLIATVVQP